MRSPAAIDCTLALGEAETGLQRFLERGIRGLNLWPDAHELRYAIAIQPVASPVHRATVHVSATVTAGDQRWFVQRTHDDLAELVDERVALVAATRAGELGIAPPVVAHDAGSRTTAYGHLPDGSRWCRVDDLAAPAILDATLATLRALHRSPPLGAARDPFAAIESQVELAGRRDVAPPGDHLWLEHQVRVIAAALTARQDPAPCHGDGAASNVILMPDGDVRLVDFDAGGDADPLYDIGALLLEACPSEPDYEDALARLEGRVARVTLARCRLYGIVDDVRWGLWGRLAAALSDRPTIEFFKYGEWRLLRARHNLRDRRFADWLRAAAR